MSNICCMRWFLCFVVTYGPENGKSLENLLDSDFQSTHENYAGAFFKNSFRQKTIK